MEKVKLNQKIIGLLLVVLAVVLFIILTFVKINFDSQAVLLCQAVNANPEMDMSECPAHKSNLPWLVIAGFVISFLVFLVGMYFISSNKLNKKLDKKKFAIIDVSKLNQEELKKYNLLKESEGSMYQSDLIKETDFTKVKVTRILDKMEVNGIIDRKRRGMTNIVVLK